MIQHILENGDQHDRARVLQSVKGRIVQLSQHKFASNVIEKCVTSSTREERAQIISEVCQNSGWFQGLSSGLGMKIFLRLSQSKNSNKILKPKIDFRHEKVVASV